MSTTKKKSGGIAAILLVFALVLAGCPTDDKGEPNPTDTFVAVTDITGVPTTATVGTALSLTGTVEPSNATNKTISWSVVSGSATISGSSLNATASGAVIVRATITNGTAQSTNYTKDFTITVSGGSGGETFVAVTDITGVPTTATVGTALSLTGTVEPSNATNKTISWSVVSGSASISGSNLNATTAGTVTVNATITNGTAQGTNYTKDFSITVDSAFVPVTNITGVPTAATVGTALTLTGTVEPVTATNKTISWSIVSGSATVSGSTLNATVAGAVTVRATITNGTAQSTDYTQNFNITVSDGGPLTDGLFTLTGLDDYNGKYAFLVGNRTTYTSFIYGFKERNGTGASALYTWICVPISNNKAEIPLFAFSGINYSNYNYTETPMMINVYIKDSETVNYTNSAAAIQGATAITFRKLNASYQFTSGIQFTNGKGTADLSDADDVVDLSW